MMTNQAKRVFEALVTKREMLTAKQIRSRFNIANPYDAVYQLRMAGVEINQGSFTDTKGRVKNKYFHGKNA